MYILLCIYIIKNTFYYILYVYIINNYNIKIKKLNQYPELKTHPIDLRLVPILHFWNQDPTIPNWFLTQPEP